MATLRDVIKFFVTDIDGMGINDGFIRNLGVPGILELCNDWKFCELTNDEFMRLAIPDGTYTLIKDKKLDSTEGSSKATIIKYLEDLRAGNELSPLIIRNQLMGEPEHFSFYIEDGAHRAIAYKIYLDECTYKSVRAYIGRR